LPRPAVEARRQHLRDVRWDWTELVAFVERHEAGDRDAMCDRGAVGSAFDACLT
jgi:hypothetical protein